MGEKRPPMKNWQFYAAWATAAIVGNIVGWGLVVWLIVWLANK